MTASKLILLTGLASCLIVVAVAVSALGLFPAAAPASHPAASATSGSGSGTGWSNATYSVSFAETGLPTGTFWSVHVEGAGGHSVGPVLPQVAPLWGWGGHWWNGSTNSTLGFQVRNGTYDFFVGSAWNGSTLYSPSPSHGNVTVSGSALTVQIAFAPVTFYNVSFSETGLPGGTFWSVHLSGGGSPGAGRPGSPRGFGPACQGYRGIGSNNSTINFSRTNGTYSYSIGPVLTSSGVYAPVPARGNVTVDGASVTVQVVFSPLVFYNVTFAETGLPSGTFWSVGLHAGGFSWPQWNGSTGGNVNFTVANGTYHFRVLPVWTEGGIYVAAPETGNVTVDGANVVVAVTFTLSDTTSGSWGHVPAQG